MQPLPDGAMPEAIEARGEHDCDIVKDLHEAIALAQANPRWPDPWLVDKVAGAQKAVDHVVHCLKMKAAADALPRPPEGCAAEAPGPRCGQPYRIKVEPNGEEEIAWPSLPRPPDAAGISK